MTLQRKLDRAAALAAIASVVGAKYATADEAALAPHLVEPRGLWRGRAAILVRPGTTDEVARVVSLCRDAGLAIVPQGGNTSLCGNAVPYEDFDGVIVATDRLDRVREVDVANNTITVEAGCILADLQRVAAEHDRLFPLSLGAEGSCRIGGNLSTNAGGVAVLRYGNARELMLGLEVVLPDGRVWNGLRALRKDNTGYALRHLFVGAEGTLGIITAAALKLFPLPRERVTALAALPDAAAAVALLGRLQTAVGDAVTGYEIMSRIGVAMCLRHIPGSVDPFPAPHPQYQLIELSGQRADGSLRAGLEEALAAAHADGLVRDAVIADSLAQAGAFWRLRETIPEAQKFEGGSIKHDVAVPVSRVAAFIRRATEAVEAALPGVRVVAFGHVGDGNIHFNLSQPVAGWTTAAFLAEWERMNRIVHDLAEGMGGTFSAEHGIGRLKRGELVRYRSAVEVDLMRALKAAIDPAGLMNPGKIL
jgi:FAD/FMN-containing dehydrogenase